MTDKHLFIIPTHKECISAIEGYLTELISIGSYTNLVFVLLDSSKKEDFCKNHQKLLEYRRKVSDLSIYHVKQELLDRIIIESLEGNLSEKIINLLVGETFSYGKMMNRIAIIANLLGCNYIHRRDSDTRPQLFQNMSVSSLEIELKLLGSYWENKQIFMVGSSYVGDWGIDYSELSDDMNLLKKLFKLSKSNYTEEQLEDYIINKYINGSSDFYHGIDYYSFQQNNYIDAGNYSLYKIFNFIPVNPAINTSGTDYIYHELLEIYDYSKLFHNRRVVHEYSKNRYQLIPNNLYNEAKLYSRLVGIYNKKMCKYVQRKLQECNDFKNIRQLMIEGYNSLLSIEDMKNEVTKMISEFEHTYREIANKKYDDFLLSFDFNFDKIYENVKLKISNYIILLEYWDSIVSLTKNNCSLLGNLKI